jgi:ABC-2 type transport system ATP-binding protein
VHDDTTHDTTTTQKGIVMAAQLAQLTRSLIPAPRSGPGRTDHEPTMIKARGLAKTYAGRRGVVQAVKGVDLEVHRGEIVGFLGPNGAGKTTTLQMLTTLLLPTSGNATVAGHDLRADPAGVRRSIGYVAQGGSAGSDARVAEELAFQARFYGIPADVATARAGMLLERLDLGGLGDRDVKTLSGGQRRRLDIALGLVHSPALVFLDEPTTGLDPQSRSNMWHHIARLREGGATVFLTTHYLEEADALCDRILIIDDGRIVAQGTPDELKNQVSGDLLTLTVSGDQAAVGAIAAIAAEFADRGDVQITSSHAQMGRGDSKGTQPGTVSTVCLRTSYGDRAAIGVLRRIDAAGLVLDGLTVARPTLDDVFLTLTGRTLREETAS